MPEVRNIKKIRLTLQENNYECWPATGRMWLSYYGLNVTKAKLRRATDTTKEGTDSVKIVEYLRSLQIFDVLEYENNLKQAKRYLRENTPLFICYNMFGNPEYSHYALVAGIRGGKIILLNPYAEKKEEVIEEYDMKWFQYWWQATKYWFVVLRKK